MTNPYMTTVVDAALTEFDRRVQSDAYFHDSVAWADYMLAIRLWSKQREICVSVKDHKSVAVKAGHGVGKSFLAAVLICWWMDTRYPKVYVATTAPSTAQINA